MKNLFEKNQLKKGVNELNNELEITYEMDSELRIICNKRFNIIENKHEAIALMLKTHLGLHCNECISLYNNLEKGGLVITVKSINFNEKQIQNLIDNYLYIYLRFCFLDQELNERISYEQVANIIASTICSSFDGSDTERISLITNMVEQFYIRKRKHPDYCQRCKKNDGIERIQTLCSNGEKPGPNIYYCLNCGQIQEDFPIK